MPEPSLNKPSDRTLAPTVTFTLRPIGLVHASPGKRARVPKYFVPKGKATLELFHPYFQGLQGLCGGMDIWVLAYHTLSGRIPADSWQGGHCLPGVFATTSIERPNAIEFLRARIQEIDPGVGLLQVEGLDVEDGAPILDIRPATSPHHRLT